MKDVYNFIKGYVKKTITATLHEKYIQEKNVNKIIDWEN